MKLLVAEDEAIIRLDICEILQSYGHEVVAQAKNGEEAVEKAFSTSLDCVLMDAHMDGDDGVLAAAAIAEAGICPVVMVTAYSQLERVREASSAGVYGYVIKPFSERSLIAAIEVARDRFIQEANLADQVNNLKELMESRRIITQAKCLLMEQGLSEKDAFARLRKASMDTRKPLAQVAEAVIISHCIDG